MEVLENRVASFAAKPAYYAKKKGKLAPQKLAESGFFYEGKTGDPRRITCFQCRESLDEATSDTDPLEEHANLHPDCPRVLLQVFHRKWIQSGGKEHTEYAVNADIIVQARVATFLRGWPNNKSGWKCTPEKLAEAGFSFHPNADATDFAECLCCNLGLDGWEKDDDPIYEHRKRNETCLFFRFPAEAKSASSGSASAAVEQATSASAAEPEAEPEVEAEAEAEPPAPTKAKAQRKKGAASRKGAKDEGAKEEPAQDRVDEIPEETKDELVEDVPPNSGASQQASQQTSQESVSKGTKKAAASKTSKKRGKAAKQEDADEAVDDVSNTENEIPVEVNKPDSQPEPKETAKRGRKKVEKEKSSKSEAAIIEEPVAMDVDVVEQVVGEGKKAVSTLRSLSGTVAPTAPQTKPMLRRIEDDEMDMTVEQLLRTIIGEQKASLEAEGNRLKASYLAKVDLVRDLMG